MTGVQTCALPILDRELVLRYIAFKLCPYKEFYEKKIVLSTFLDKTMEKIDSKDFTKEKFEELKNDLLNNLKFLSTLFDKDILFNKRLVDKSKTATLNRSLFEVWTVLISNLTENEKQKIYENKELLTEKYKKLLIEEEFEDSITKEIGRASCRERV